MTSIAILNKQSIIEQVAQGIRLADIAEQLGITRQAISLALTDDPEYQAAQLNHHAARIDKGERMMEDANDALSLARARELHKAYSWRASVEMARIWGNKQELNVNNYNVDMRGILADRETKLATISRVIEHEGESEVPSE